MCAQSPRFEFLRHALDVRDPRRKPSGLACDRFDALWTHCGPHPRYKCTPQAPRRKAPAEAALSQTEAAVRQASMSQPAQPDMGDRPAPHAPGAEVMPALVLPGPARPPSAHAHPAFVEGLAPSYTLAFARHLLDGRVALKRARAVL